MNLKQRNKNRSTARWLRSMKPCSECGEPGAHFIQEPMTLIELLDGREPSGFWTCAKFYGPDGRRLPQYTDRRDPMADVLAVVAAISKATA